MEVAVRDLKVGDIIHIWSADEVVETTEEWSWEADSFSLTFASNPSKSYAFTGVERYTLVSSAAETGPLPTWEADLIEAYAASKSEDTYSDTWAKPAETPAETLDDGRLYRWVRADSLEGGDMIWRAGEDYMVDSVKVTGHDAEFEVDRLNVRFLGIDVVTHWFGDSQVQLITG